MLSLLCTVAVCSNHRSSERPWSHIALTLKEFKKNNEVLVSTGHKGSYTLGRATKEHTKSNNWKIVLVYSQQGGLIFTCSVFN